jgi:hypothetical protein
MSPTVTVTFPASYPDYLLQMFSQDILDACPPDTIISVCRQIELTNEIKEGLNFISQKAEEMSKGWK